VDWEGFKGGFTANSLVEPQGMFTPQLKKEHLNPCISNPSTNSTGFRIDEDLVFKGQSYLLFIGENPLNRGRIYTLWRHESLHAEHYGEFLTNVNSLINRYKSSTACIPCGCEDTFVQYINSIFKIYEERYTLSSNELHIEDYHGERSNFFVKEREKTIERINNFTNNSNEILNDLGSCISKMF